MPAAPPSPGIRLWRRVVMAAVVVLSATGIAAGYSGSRVLAWQMFPEASRWQADIVRVTFDGTRHTMTTAWPGGYVWEELVTKSGLRHPDRAGNASYGVATTLDALQHALDWVAANTPDDDATLYLEAVVTYRYNDAPWETVVLTSQHRES